MVERIDFLTYLETEFNEHRGLYGQPEGPTQHANSFFDRIDLDNNVAEGDFVATLNRMIRNKNLQGAAEYVEKLRQQGHSIDRLYSMLTRALYKAI